MKSWVVILLSVLGGALAGGSVVFLSTKSKPQMEERVEVEKNSFSLDSMSPKDKKGRDQTDRYTLPDDQKFDNSRDQRRAQLRNQMRDKMRQMRQQMQKFWDDEEADARIFDRAFGNARGGLFGGMRFHNAHRDFISKKEDKDHVIYEIDLKNVDENSLQIDIKDNQLFVKGESRTESNDNTGNSFSSSTMISSFSQSFPIPRYADASKAKIEKLSKKLQIKVPKKGASL